MLVRSYRTFSPLPVTASGPSAVCFLLHFPSPHDAWLSASTLPCGGPTFLDTIRFRRICRTAATQSTHHRSQRYRDTPPARSEDDEEFRSENLSRTRLNVASASDVSGRIVRR